MMTLRQQKAAEIADRFRIVKNGSKWVVPSQSGSGKYFVRVVGSISDCTCPDFELRGGKCKHILAVEYSIQREQNADGSETITETIRITQRAPYPQEWSAYNEAQTNEQDRFQALLHDLCSTVVTAPQAGRGQRRLPLSDAIFSATFKVYSTVSGRRFMSDLREAHKRGFIAKVPHFNSIFNYLENPDVTPILRDMIVQSSLPLKAVEEDFAVDSSGFSTSKFVRWFDHKYGTERLEHGWVKVHLMCGVKTNVVTAVEIKERYTSDTIMMPALVETTANNFQLHEVSADKAYLSIDNVRAVKKAKATPFIPFRSNSTGVGGRHSSSAYTEMFHYFMYRRDDFLHRYHKRSNVETTFSMIKRKFGDSLRSKTETAMVNEALCKVLCHNLVVLIHEMIELGIEPKFRCAELASAQQDGV